MGNIIYGGHRLKTATQRKIIAGVAKKPRLAAGAMFFGGGGGE
jgi:hypothetical protein